MKSSSTILVTVLTTLTCVSAKFRVYDDLFRTPKYTINHIDDRFYTNHEVKDILETPTNETYEILKSPERPVLCHIPQFQPTEQNETINITDKIEELTQIISDTLLEKDLFHKSSYWSFIVTKDGEVAQFEGNSPTDFHSPNSKKFLLGKFDESEKLQGLKINDNGEGVSLSHTLDGGSTCDLTSNPRSVDLQYVCDRSYKAPRLLSVKEYKSCHYRAQINIPKLCDHILLKEEEETVLDISCKRIIDVDNEVISQTQLTRDEFFTDHSNQISIHHHTLNKIGRNLFTARKNPNEAYIVLINTSDNIDDLVPRFGRSYFEAFQNGHFTNSLTEAKFLLNSLDYTFEIYVYDKIGKYATTIEVKPIKDEAPANATKRVTIRTVPYRSKIKENFRDIKVNPVMEIEHESGERVFDEKVRDEL